MMIKWIEYFKKNRRKYIVAKTLAFSVPLLFSVQLNWKIRFIKLHKITIKKEEDYYLKVSGIQTAGEFATTCSRFPV